jgi:hypothetical protein
MIRHTKPGPTREQLLEYAKQNNFNSLNENSKGLDSSRNYRGPGLELVVVSGVGRNRDSELLDESNFEAALEMLGGESKSVVEVHRFGHWGCGWFELILVNPKAIKKLKIAYEVTELLNHYPVLDDSDYYEREADERHDYAEKSKSELAEALTKHFGLPEVCAKDKLLIDLSYALQYEVQYQCGNDAAINIYTFRDPDESDVTRLLETIKSLGDNSFIEDNPYFEYFKALFGLSSPDLSLVDGAV